LKASYFAQGNGVGQYTLNFVFSDGDATKEAHLVLTLTKKFNVSWNIEGAVTSESYDYGAIPFYNGAPTKEPSAQYTYTFEGWDMNGDGEVDELLAVNGDVTYVAVFSRSVNSYGVTWDVDGAKETVKYEYGATPSYDKTPTKASDIQYDYVFKGWDKGISPVRGDVTYTAVFDKTVRKYMITVVVDGSSVSMQAEYGAMPVLSDPTKASDAQYHYAFTGWSPAVSTVYGNQTYTAQFERTLRQYTVTWVVDGSEEKQTYDYGALPVYDGTPTKESDPEKHFFFTGKKPLLILENLSFLDRIGANIILRIPLIPGYNATTEHLNGIREVVQTFRSIQKVEVLPYHPLGVSKEAELGWAKKDTINVPDKACLEGFMKDLNAGLGITAEACI